MAPVFYMTHIWVVWSELSRMVALVLWALLLNVECIVWKKHCSKLSVHWNFFQLAVTHLNTPFHCIGCGSLWWSPYVIGQTIIFLPCDFYLLLSSSFFFSLPDLSGQRLDVYHTSTHAVALVRIYNACLKCAARHSLKIQDAKMTQKLAIWAPSHNFVGLYLRN